MAKPKEPLNVRVHFEPITPEAWEVLKSIVCHIELKLNLEQTAQEVRKNAGGKYDDLFVKEETA